MAIGELMHTSGAEAGRVEDTIRRICMAYGATRVDVFSITSCIVTTMFGEGFDSCTQTRRVQSMKNDFYKLDELNQLSRWICETHPGPEKIPARIDRIRRGKTYGFWKQLLIYYSATLLTGVAFKYCRRFSTATSNNRFRASDVAHAI